MLDIRLFSGICIIVSMVFVIDRHMASLNVVAFLSAPVTDIEVVI